MTISTTDAPAIRLRHVTHRFGPAVAIDDLSVDVPRGEIFGFIGPNGAGKTTTIRILSTLLEPTSGRVEIEGIDAIADPTSVRRVVGYMPDHAGVYERITVREYLEFFAAAAGVRGPRPVEAAIELTGLGDWQERLVATLSKGMRQRLGLSRVLLHEPSVLVLDEPASDLDPRARIDMRDLLLELRNLGKTILLSSHILAELDDVCTSIGIIDKGRLLVAGPIGDIAARLGTRPGEEKPDETSRPAADETAPRVTEVASRCARVRIRILGEAADVLPLVRNIAGVVSASASSDGLVAVTHDRDERLVAEVVRRLVDSGAGIIAVEPERAELERIFLEVTKAGDE